MLTQHQRNYLVVAVAVVLALSLASSAVCVTGPRFIARLPLPFGYLMSVCGVYRAQPQLQLGLTWASPFLSSMVPPYGGPGGGCYSLPWLPVLPQRGSLLIP